MAGLLFKTSRRRKRRLKSGLQDDKTFKLYRAACRLLAGQDYEHIPVAHFAQAAEMSVGAFYERFSDKNAFLDLVIAMRLSGLRQRMEQRLDLTHWQSRSSAAVIQALVEEMMRNLHGHGAGVVRAALKRGHLDRTKLEPLQRYRTALADRAVALLTKRIAGKKPEPVIRAAVQMADATALDALLHEKGPLRPGGRHMAATLSGMMLSVLKPTGSRTEDASDDDLTEVTDDVPDSQLDMPAEEIVALPIPETPTGHKRIPSPRTRPSEAAEKIPMLQPTTARQPQEDEKPLPTPKPRRHRPRI